MPGKPPRRDDDFYAWSLEQAALLAIDEGFLSE
jgi:hypothetical protein